MSQDKELIERLVEQAYETYMKQALRPQDRAAVIGTCTSFLAAYLAERGKEAVAWVEVINRHEGPYNFHGKELLDSGRHDLFLAPQPAIPEGMVLVSKEIVDRFPEINPSNYDHDGVCALNAWGVELILSIDPAVTSEQASALELARTRMAAAKNVVGWDEVPYKLHVALDALFDVLAVLPRSQPDPRDAALVR